MIDIPVMGAPAPPNDIPVGKAFSGVGPSMLDPMGGVGSFEHEHYIYSQQLEKAERWKIIP